MKNYQDVTRELMVVERAAWWNPRVRRILKVAPLVVMFLLLNTRGARASCSFNPTPDPTADGASNSLRAAIEAANASGQDCVIELQAGTYTLTIKNTNGQENNAAEGDLDITDSGHTVTIQGQGAKASIVNGGGVKGIDDRVFQVLGGANAVFRKLTIEGGIARDDGTAGAQPGTTESDGGGILVQDRGHVALSHVYIEGNRAIGGNGTNTSFSPIPGEPAAGGGLFLSSGAVELTGSKISGDGAIGGTGGNGNTCASSPGLGGGGGPSSGGGLYVLSGDARLFRSTLSGNAAAGGAGGAGRGTCDGGAGEGGAGGQGAGGGLYVLSGSAELSRSTVSGNAAMGGLGGPGGFFGGSGDRLPGGNGGAGQGAGLFIGGGALSLKQTTLSGNSAMGGEGGIGALIFPTHYSRGGSSQGAGIFVASGKIGLANSTLFANKAKGGPGGYTPPYGSIRGSGGDAAGGGLYLNSGEVSLKGDTVASNQALATTIEPAPQGSSFGGGITNPSATSLVTNTTLIANNTQDSGNTNNGDDVSGAITSSYSLIGQTAGATITNGGGNILDEDSLLDPGGLRWNGGPTQTVALQIGSPAIDTGDNAVCSASPPTGLGGVDQRGYRRFPHGDNRCDIGAFEFYNLLVHPHFESFGSQPVGQQTPSRNISITNNQQTMVTVSNTIGGTDPADFIENDNCGGSLGPNQSCAISISFKPAASGHRNALITVSDSPDRTSPFTVQLTGEGK